MMALTRNDLANIQDVDMKGALNAHGSTMTVSAGALGGFSTTDLTGGGTGGLQSSKTLGAQRLSPF